MRILTDFKDLIRLHNFQWGELENLVPYEYEAIRLMIAEDIKKDNENSQ